MNIQITVIRREEEKKILGLIQRRMFHVIFIVLLALVNIVAGV